MRWVTRAAGGWGLPGPGIFRPPRPGLLAYQGRARRLWRSPVLTATINGVGQAMVFTGPDGGTTWYVREATVFATTNGTYQPLCQIYRGGANGVPLALLGTSFAGAGDTIGCGGKPIVVGETCVAVFQQGAPGSMISVLFEGEQEILV